MGVIKDTIAISEDAIAGAYSGFIARLLSAPFDLIKIRQQLSSSTSSSVGMVKSMQEIVRHEGPFALWKGNMAATYLWVSYAFVQFGIYGRLKLISNQATGDDQQILRATALFGAGAIAGL
jgi:solute carrier family 25 (mitochondrial thiamine pyrophosphate transporter), member 19